MNAPFSTYAAEIYLAGSGGAVPAFSTDLTALEDSARARMAPAAFGYVAGGAGAGATMRANRDAFDRWRIVPRMLTGSHARAHGTTVLGEAVPAPILLAPVGVQSIVHPSAELGAARVAAELGLPMILSTASSHTIEEVAGASGDGPRWFQLYWPNDEAVCRSLLHRARAAGFSVLVVTIDLWTLGWRPLDLDRAYLPFAQGLGTAIPYSDPAFLSRLAASPAADPAAAFGHWVQTFTGTDRTWEDLSFLRAEWDGPVVLKGVQHVDDARRAVEAGVSGIVVSNHGGRQVDGAIASLDALPGIAAAVGEEIEVLFDSGVRNGADVVKALALGARAVLVGRPWIYGMAHAGEDGVRHVLRSLLADFDLTMALSGHAGPADVTRQSVVRI